MGDELLVLGVLFVIAYALGRLGKLVGLPSIPIYMLVGLLASPNSSFFPISVGSETIELVAVVGLVLLLFNLGIEFDQEEFFGNFRRLIASGGIYIALNIGAGLAFGFALGWGTREALIVAGMTATSSSAIVTKLLIELRRLANDETPTILGISVVEDIVVAVYLAIVSVVLSGATEPWPVIGRLGISFAFLVLMFVIARWGGRVVSGLFGGRDDELFTILFVGLAVAFAGIGEILGVTDAIGAFLIGLVLGATRHRDRIQEFAKPLRDVFAAFFFVNFGLALDVTKFGGVVVPVLAAVLMTFVLNVVGGQLVARLNGLGTRAGVNTAFVLQNRGEFALILATLAAASGLDARVVPFAGLYVLILAVVGPVLATNSERIAEAVIGPLERRRQRRVDRRAARAGATDGALEQPLEDGSIPRAERPEGGLVEIGADADDAADRERTRAAAVDETDEDADLTPEELDRLIEQAMADQSPSPRSGGRGGERDEPGGRPRDPEY